MERPEAPTADELKRLKAYSSEAAKALIDEYVRAVGEHNRTSIAERMEAIRRSRDTRQYQTIALTAGLMLAAASFAFCGYAIERHVDIRQISLILVAIDGMAGVFLFKAAPRKRSSSLGTTKGLRTPVPNDDASP